MRRCFAGLAVLGIALTRPVQASPQSLPERAAVSIFSYDRTLPLDIEYEAETQESGYRVLDLSYASPAGGRVPALLFVPDGDGSVPGIILLHGMPGNRHNSRWLAEGYAAMGAVALAITAPFARPEERPRERPITLTATDRDEQIQLIQDLQRGVDLLLAHPRVDGSRIGFSGGSYGAAMGGLFAGVESRVKAYALWVGDGGLVSHVTGEDDRGGRFDRLTPARQREWLDALLPIEPIRFVGMAAPAVLFFQAARLDRVVPVSDAERFIAAGSEPKQVRWYETGHGLNAQAFRDQARWMAGQLGLDFAPGRKGDTQRPPTSLTTRRRR